VRKKWCIPLMGSTVVACNTAGYMPLVCTLLVARVHATPIWVIAYQWCGFRIPRSQLMLWSLWRSCGHCDDICDISYIYIYIFIYLFENLSKFHGFCNKEMHQLFVVCYAHHRSLWR
jgi:hypothetical protein